MTYHELVGADGVEIGVQDGELVVKTGGSEQGRVKANGTSSGVFGSGGSSLPTGGTTGQLLAKNSNTNGDVHWIDDPSGGKIALPAGGTAGQFLKKNSSTDGDASWVDVKDADAIAKALGIIAWTFDPVQSVTLTTHTSGNIHACGVYLLKGQVIGHMGCYLGAAAVTPSHFQLGIYDAGYNLVAASADTPASLGSAGYVELALTSTYTVPSDGLYYFADLFAATTMPTVLTISTVTQAGRSLLPSSAQYRQFNPGTVNTSLPNPIVPATSGATNFVYAR